MIYYSIVSFNILRELESWCLGDYNIVIIFSIVF